MSIIPLNMASKNPQIKVGIGIFVLRNGKLLLSKRKGSHGAGEYGGPGGHLEFRESIEECARRECKEEAGIEIKNIRFLCLSNIKQYNGKHYVDIGLMADCGSGEPKTLEPQKCEGWKWYSLNKLPGPLFAAEKFYIEALKTGRNFFDLPETLSG